MSGKRRRRTYDKAFKYEAVRLVLEEGCSAAEVERGKVHLLVALSATILSFGPCIRQAKVLFLLLPLEFCKLIGTRSFRSRAYSCFKSSLVFRSGKQVTVNRALKIHAQAGVVGLIGLTRE